MSKKAKELCGYQAKPVQQTCGNCAAFAFDKIIPDWLLADGRTSYCGRPISVEEFGVTKNQRCTAFAFATKRSATCNEWKAAEAVQKGAK